MQVRPKSEQLAGPAGKKDSKEGGSVRAQRIKTLSSKLVVAKSEFSSDKEACCVFKANPKCARLLCWTPLNANSCCVFSTIVFVALCVLQVQLHGDPVHLRAWPGVELRADGVQQAPRQAQIAQPGGACWATTIGVATGTENSQYFTENRRATSSARVSGTTSLPGAASTTPRGATTRSTSYTASATRWKCASHSRRSARLNCKHISFFASSSPLHTVNRACLMLRNQVRHRALCGAQLGRGAVAASAPVGRQSGRQDDL